MQWGVSVGYKQKHYSLFSLVHRQFPTLTINPDHQHQKLWEQLPNTKTFRRQLSTPAFASNYSTPMLRSPSNQHQDLAATINTINRQQAAPTFPSTPPLAEILNANTRQQLPCQHQHFPAINTSICQQQTETHARKYVRTYLVCINTSIPATPNAHTYQQPSKPEPIYVSCSNCQHQLRDER